MSDTKRMCGDSSDRPVFKKRNRAGRGTRVTATLDNTDISEAGNDAYVKKSNLSLIHI